MGNRAVITTKNTSQIPILSASTCTGTEAATRFRLSSSTASKRLPPAGKDCYGWARLCQVVGNYFGGGLSIGIDACSRLDCDNWDNGVYIIEGWEIVDRRFAPEEEQQQYDLLEMLRDINEAQPPKGTAHRRRAAKGQSKSSATRLPF